MEGMKARMATAVALVALFSFSGWAAADNMSIRNHCSRTSLNALFACKNEAADDFWIMRGNCENLPTPEERRACMREARIVMLETLEECWAQYEARQEICEDLGQNPYHPEIDPDDFVDYIDNPLFPHTPGTTLVYEGETEDGLEHIEVFTSHEMVEIMGVECLAVVDTVWLAEKREDGGWTDDLIIEDTVDWFAQDIHGNVWYFGEISFEYEDGEVVSLDGSWKAGEEGAKPGIVMFGTPEVGTVYRQEWFLGDAEDMGEVLSLDESVEVEFGSFDNCLMTKDYSPLEPEVFEHKYFAGGVGFILEIKPETGEQIELIDIIVE